MSHLVALLQPKGQSDARLIQVTQGLQDDLEARFARMDGQFFEGVDEFIAFDGGYTPDENQMLQIGLTQEMQDLVARLAMGAAGQDRYDPNAVVPDEVRALLWLDDSGQQPRILIQNFTRAQAVTRRGVVISWGDGNTFRKLDEPAILIGDRIDGVIWDGRFQFRSFFLAKQIFDLTAVYREATAEEVQEFSDSASIHTEQANFADRLNATQRTLIFAINRADTLNRLTVAEIEERAVAAGFQLRVQDNQVVLPSGPPLTPVLRFLNNGLYRSPIDDELYVSNSHRRYRR